MTTEIPTIRCGNKDVPHNTQKWRSCTNRHTSTSGNSWGWIEGAPGNICWSNDGDSDFTSRDASDVVAAHNQWLEEQRPLALRIVEAREEMERRERLSNEAQANFRSRYTDFEKAKAEHERLVALQHNTKVTQMHSEDGASNPPSA